MTQVNRYYWFEVAFGTICDRIMYDALEGKKVASADWADPANRCESHGGGMEETFGRTRNLNEKVEEALCKIKLVDRLIFHENYVNQHYGSKEYRRSQNAQWEF